MMFNAKNFRILGASVPAIKGENPCLEPDIG
jgi:hypothetical protein